MPEAEVAGVQNFMLAMALAPPHMLSRGGIMSSPTAPPDCF